MSFGGSVGAMLASIKNNKRKRPSVFEKLENYSESNDKLYFDKTATKEELKKIREKFEKENNRISVRNGFIYITILTILIYFLAFHDY